VCVRFSTQSECTCVRVYLTRGGSGHGDERATAELWHWDGCKQQAFERQWRMTLLHAAHLLTPHGAYWARAAAWGNVRLHALPKRSDRMCTVCMTGWQEGWLPVGYHACTRSSDGMRALHLLTAVG